MRDIESSYVFVTGASRGIGAATARSLASKEYSVGIGLREKIKKASGVALQVQQIYPEGNHEVFQGDITDDIEKPRVIADVSHWAASHLGGLVLNAAGGLEKGKDPNYAMKVNHDAQLDLTRELRPALTPGGTIVYITSHWAHLHGQIEMPPYEYESIASSKNAAEKSLKAMIPELSDKEIRLIIVTGGIVTGTFVGDYAVRNFPEFAEQQDAIHNIVSAEDMGERVAYVIADKDLPSGHTEVVGAPLEVLKGE